MEEWDVEAADPGQQVGARHHTVPAFYLRRFANSRNQLWVRDRRSDQPGLRKESDLAIRDFYTYINTDGQPDGRLEQLLEKIETAAKPALDRASAGVTWGQPHSVRDREDITLLMAFQFVRGQRKRRETEVTADLYMRLFALDPGSVPGGRKSPAYYERLRDLETLEAKSDPNEHLTMLGRTALVLHPHLLNRPMTVVALTDAALLTCDEPIAAFCDDDGPGPVIPPVTRRARSRRRRGQRVLRHTRQLVQIQSTAKRGVARAEQIVMPIGRRKLLVLGQPGTQAPSHHTLDPGESQQAAAALNEELLSQTYLSAYAHPDDRGLLAQVLPELGPLYRVGGLQPRQARIATAPLEDVRPMLYGRR